MNTKREKWSDIIELFGYANLTVIIYGFASEILVFFSSYVLEFHHNVSFKIKIKKCHH